MEDYIFINVCSFVHVEDKSKKLRILVAFDMYESTYYWTQTPLYVLVPFDQIWHVAHLEFSGGCLSCATVGSQYWDCSTVVEGMHSNKFPSSFSY